VEKRGDPMVGERKFTIQVPVILCLIVAGFPIVVLSPPQEEWNYNHRRDINDSSRIRVDNTLSVVLAFDSEGDPT